MAVDTVFTDILNMSALGDKLREIRESKNLTLSQAQKQTRIHQTVLKALEEGKCDGILNPAYEKSFLKQYAEYLGIDSRQVLTEYKRLRQIAEPGRVNKLPDPEAGSKRLSGIMPLVKFVIIGAVAVAIIAVAGSGLISYLKRPHPAKRPAAQAKPQKKAAKAAAETAIPKDVQLKLLLKVNQNVLVKMKTDGVLMFERVLTKGTAEVFTADKVINIYAANGNSIELVLNGKPVGSLGKGVLKNIEITRAGVKIK
ncbi:MAG: RodZ domain-containing protein [Candidatus Omnitrophota bacterium]